MDLITPQLLLIPGVGWPELVAILLVVLVIFGPKKLPEIGRALGESMRELRKSTQEKDDETEKKEADNASAATAASATATATSGEGDAVKAEEAAPQAAAQNSADAPSDSSSDGSSGS